MPMLFVYYQYKICVGCCLLSDLWAWGCPVDGLRWQFHAFLCRETADFNHTSISSDFLYKINSQLLPDTFGHY